jgi:lipoprotein-releasing system permease protein
VGLLLVAWRYLVARPITLVSTASVMVGLVAIVVVDSVMNGFRAEQRSMIRAIAPDVSVDVTGLDRDAAAALLAKVRAQPGVRVASGRVEVPAIHNRSGAPPAALGVVGVGDDQFVDVVGVEPAEKDSIAALARLVVQRPEQPFWFGPADPYWTARMSAQYRHRDDLVPILFGDDLLRRCLYEAGDVVTLRTLAGEARSGEPLTVQDQQCVVVGSFRTKDVHFDRTHALAPRERLVEFAQLKTPMQEIALTAASGLSDDALRDQLRAALAGSVASDAVETWADRKHLLLGAVETERRVMNVAMFFVVIVATFSLFATLHQMVRRKTHDVGVLVALGATQLDAGRVFLTCGLMVTLAGALLGVFGGLGLAQVLNPLLGAIEGVTGWTLFDRNLFAMDHLPIRVDLGRIGGFALGTVVCGTLFTLLPSLRAARLDPVEALRHE